MKKSILTFFLCMQHFFILNSFASNNYKFYLITNPKNAGELNQLRGVAISLEKVLITENVQPENFSIEEVDFNETKELYNSNEISGNDNKLVFITSGAATINTLLNLAKQYPNALSVHLSHQIYDDHEKLIKNPETFSGIDLIVLPKHEKVQDIYNRIAQSSTKLLLINGVAHNLAKKDIEQELTKYQDEIPQDSNYLIVVLAGDAENKDQSWRYFTIEDAIKLAQKIESHIKKTNPYIIVTNGPRTGRYNPLTGNETKAHKDGNVDPVTSAFIKYFHDKKYSKIALFDFQAGKPQMHKALLGAFTTSKKGEIWIPAESTSMISEAIDILDIDHNHQVYFYEHNAMNDSHKAYLNGEVNDGRVKAISKSGAYIKTKTPSILSTNIIAKKIFQMLAQN